MRITCRLGAAARTVPTGPKGQTRGNPTTMPTRKGGRRASGQLGPALRVRLLTQQGANVVLVVGGVHAALNERGGQLHELEGPKYGDRGGAGCWVGLRIAQPGHSRQSTLGRSQSVSERGSGALVVEPRWSNRRHRAPASARRPPLRSTRAWAWPRRRPVWRRRWSRPSAGREGRGRGGAAVARRVSKARTPAGSGKPRTVLPCP